MTSLNIWIVESLSACLYFYSRGHPAGGHGGWWGHQEPMVDPHTAQVLLCVCSFVRGEAGLDQAHRGLPVKPVAGQSPSAQSHLRCHLDPRQSCCQMFALFHKLHSHQTSSPLPKMWLFGLQFMLQTASGDTSHWPHWESQGLQTVLQGRWDISPEGGQYWKDQLRGGRRRIQRTWPGTWVDTSAPAHPTETVTTPPHPTSPIASYGDLLPSVCLWNGWNFLWFIYNVMMNCYNKE